jgi:hypothetical protein
MDGKWNRGDERAEQIDQAALNRMRLLTVNTSATLTNFDASGEAGVDPTTITSDNGGPHWILSPETPDGRPCLGFELGLLENLSVVAGSRATPNGTTFEVTIWRLVTATQLDSGVTIPRWLAFETVDIGFNQLFHSFDVNTAAIRVQIGNILQQGSLTLAIAEL